MLCKYYVDTSIWRDYIENRTDRFRPLGEWALEFFRMVEKEKGKILYSNLVIDELNKRFDESKIKEIIGIIDKSLIEIVKIAKEDVIEASTLSKKRNIPFGDSLHAILARNNNAILVSRDHHFEEVQDIVESKKPEELI